MNEFILILTPLAALVFGLASYLALRSKPKQAKKKEPKQLHLWQGHA